MSRTSSRDGLAPIAVVADQLGARMANPLCLDSKLGQSETYLINALTEYKEGKRKHPTMQAQAQSCSAQDIADIAAYLSSLK